MLVIKLPTVASKKFLITIGDRNVGGLIAQEQMVGKWQTPISDVAVSALAFDSDKGEAMAIGERPPIALLNAAASARLAVAESITNILSASVEKISDVSLSANWMAAAGYDGEDKNLYDAVKAIGEEFCPELNITIPVGKDSLSMRTVWDDKSVTSPLSVVISAFAPVNNVLRTVTPELQNSSDTVLIAIDLGRGKSRLGGSALQQVHSLCEGETPDIAPIDLKKMFNVVTKLKSKNRILAYHDRSDGGLWATLCEMAFASRVGLEIQVPSSQEEIPFLFNEEVGCVLQISKIHQKEVFDFIRKEIGEVVCVVAKLRKDQQIVISKKNKQLTSFKRHEVESWWSETSYLMQKARDNPASAIQEFDAIKTDSQGLSAKFDFKLSKKVYKTRPRVAIFREQGVNGHIEMAAAITEAGFTAVDVNLQDLLNNRFSLDEFVGLIACGGFSYGDVLGAGEGWAKTILANTKLRKTFAMFFERSDSFTLGVCNGCQMLSSLKELIPGADTWPRFVRNESEQFEARLTTVKINSNPSILFKDMEGAVLQVPVAHGEGKALFKNNEQRLKASKNSLVVMNYVDNDHKVTKKYPYNPNGSIDGVTSLTSTDGRATIMMPHPERAFQVRQLSWHPEGWSGHSPWFKMFQNAREWVENKSK